MRLSEPETAELVFNLNLFYSGEKEYTTTEGAKSPVYVDVNSLASFPFSRKRITDSIITLLGETGVSGTALAAAGHSGIPFASIVSAKLGIPMVYVRDSSKKHGKQNMIEGKVDSRKSYALFIDSLTDPSKAEKYIDAVESGGGSVVSVITVVNLSGCDSIVFKERKIELKSLVTLKTLVDFAVSNRFLDAETAELIQARLDGSAASKELPETREISAENAAVDKTSSRMRQEEGKQDRGFTDTNAGRTAAEILLSVSAVSLSVETPYRYASGILSPVYCDNRLLVSSPENWKTILDILENIIRHDIGLRNIEYLAGTSTAGIPHASCLAERLSLPLVYVKSESGDYGKKSFIEGTLLYGKKTLVVEDLVSTGKSSIEAVRILRKHGAVVDNCVAIFTYLMRTAEKAFREESCRLYTASDFSQMMEAAVATGYIDAAQADKAKSWNSDPENWGKMHGYEQ